MIIMNTITANETFNGTVVSFFNPLPPDSELFLGPQNLPFVIGSPEEVASSETITWLANNQAALSSEHGDHWILVEGQTVIAESDNPAALEQIATTRHIQNPLITKVPAPSPNWRTAYVACR
jgi:hypothetical protein